MRVQLGKETRERPCLQGAESLVDVETEEETRSKQIVVRAIEGNKAEERQWSIRYPMTGAELTGERTPEWGKGALWGEGAQGQGHSQHGHELAAFEKL